LTTDTSHVDRAGGRWLRGGRAALVGASWGAGEASLFFLVPDVWLGLVVVRAPAHTWPTVAAIAGGAMAGAAALRLAIRRGLDVEGWIARVPGLLPGDLERAGRELDRQGSVAFLNGPFHGLPVKLYVDQATRRDMPLREILGMTALNRLERIVPFALIVTLLAWPFRGFIRRHPLVTTAGYVAGWTAFYAWYFSSRAARSRAMRSPHPPDESPPRSRPSEG
jgi:hypothetical protein